MTSWGLANSRGASDSVIARVSGHSCCATETGTQLSAGYGGDEWFFGLF